MSRLIGWLLILCGIAIVAVAALVALNEIRDLYSGVLADPLAQPDVAEEDRPRRILIAAGAGACGLVPLIAGKVVLTRAAIRRRYAAARG